MKKNLTFPIFFRDEKELESFVADLKEPLTKIIVENPHSKKERLSCVMSQDCKFDNRGYACRTIKIIVKP